MFLLLLSKLTIDKNYLILLTVAMSHSHQYNPRGQRQPNISHLQKRQILWNIIEPGDPYDIKKSMIAKLPGDRKNFMGEHLELVCLLQAAEIQRLCQYLEEHKLKLRETQRCQLDRHSYQIQIKELTERLSEGSTQITKLRDYIKKLTDQLQSLRKTLNSYDSNLRPKYQECLRQIQSLRGERSRMQFQIQKSVARITSSQSAHQRQIQDLRRKLHDTSIFDNKMKDMQMRYQNQISQLQLRLQKLHQSNEKRKIQNENLQRNLQTISMNLQEEMDKNKKVYELKKTLQQYESRFSLVGQEIERLNLVLRNQTGELMNVQSRCNEYETQIRRKQSMIQQYHTKISSFQILIKEKDQMIKGFGNNQKVIESYQIKLQQLSRQIGRLNDVLKRKVDQNSQIIKTIKEYELEFTKIEVMKKHYQQLRVVYAQFQGMRPKIAENENRIALQASQIQRLTFTLKQLENRNKNLQGQCQQYRLTITEFQNTVPRDWNERLQMAEEKNQKLTIYIRQLEQKSMQSSKINAKNLEYESKLALLSHQVQRLNDILKKNIETLNASEQKNRSLQQNLEHQRRGYQENEKKVVAEWTMIVNKLKQQIQINRTDTDARFRNDIAKYENQIALLSQEIERLNHNLRIKLDEINSLQQKIRNFQQEGSGYVRKIEEREMEIARQWKPRVTKLQEKVTALSQQNEELRRQIKGLVAPQGYEAKIMQLSQEIDRLNGVLDKKVKQNNVLNQRIIEAQQAMARMTQQIEECRRRLRQSKELELKVSQYENKIAILGQEIERLNMTLDGSEKKSRNVYQEYENSKRRVSELQGMISQFRIKITTYEQTITTIKREKEEVIMKVQGSQNDVIQKLNNEIRIKNEELRIKEDELRNMHGELQNWRTRCRQIEESIKRDWQVRVSKYEQQVATCNRQKEQLSRKYSQINPRIGEYQNKIGLLSQEIQRLNFALRQKVEELRRIHQENDQLRDKTRNISGLSQQMEKYKSEMKFYESKCTQLGQQIERLNQVLKRKVDQINSFERQYKKLENEFQYVKKSRVQSENNTIIELRSTITKIQHDMSIYSEKLERKDRQVNDGSRRISQYENKIALLTQEIERLNYNLRIKVEQISRMESNYQEQIQRYTEKLKGMDEHVKKQIMLSQQIQRLNDVLRQMKEQSQNKSLKESQYLSDIQRLNNTLRLKVEESARWEESYKKIQIQLGGKTEQYNKIYTSYTKVIAQYQGSKKHIQQYENSIKRLYAQFERLQNVMQQMKKENISLKNQLQNSQGIVQRNRRLAAEIDRLDGIRKDLIKQNEQVNLRLANEVSLQKRINECMALMVILFAQIQSLRKRVRDKEIQVEEVRRSSLVPFRV